MTNAIEINNLCKAYPGFHLDNVSFSVPTGYVCGFVGPNGSGKTTTLKSMLGMARKESGEIRLLGESSENVALKEQIGVLFDQPYYQEDWTARDIEKGLRRFYENWDSAAFHAYLSRFDLDAGKKFKHFSRGMKMKLGMAVILSYKAKLLLLDEPTGGLDPVMRDEMLDVMRDYMREEDRSILFSTHITSDLEKLADTIVYISNGRITFQGEKDELVSKYCIVRGGGVLASGKERLAIGLRQHDAGFECLMEVSDIGGLASDNIIDQATIDDIVIFKERNSRNQR